MYCTYSLIKNVRLEIQPTANVLECMFTCSRKTDKHVFLFGHVPLRRRHCAIVSAPRVDTVVSWGSAQEEKKESQAGKKLTVVKQLFRYCFKNYETSHVVYSVCSKYFSLFEVNGYSIDTAPFYFQLRQPKLHLPIPSRSNHPFIIYRRNKNCTRLHL